MSGIDTQGGEDYQVRGGTYTAEQTVSTVRGRHSLQFGAIYQRLRTGRHDDTTTLFSYSNATDFFNNVPNQVQINFPLLPFSLHIDQFGGFIQNNFRASSNLTLNLGLRYDYWTVPKESDNRLFNRNPGPLGPGTGTLRSPESLYNSDWPNFAPRIGLAWSPRGGGRRFSAPAVASSTVLTLFTADLSTTFWIILMCRSGSPWRSPRRAHRV